MPSIEVRIPQLGEGLQEARVVRLLKQPGDAVAQDEPLYEMETDKAVLEVEAPVAGAVEAWIVREGDVVPIGAVIGSIAREGLDGQGEAAQAAPAAAPAAASAAHQQRAAAAAGPAVRNSDVPPRTRAYAREKGLSDNDLAELALRTAGKVLPAHIDQFLASAPAPAAAHQAAAYDDISLPAAQRTLVMRLQRSTQGVVPAIIEGTVNWASIDDARAVCRRLGGQARLSTPFLLFAWCVARAGARHARFRSALIGEATLRQHAHLHLGIAVGRPNDELATARIADADALSLETFTEAARVAIKQARAGDDQATDVVQVVISNLAGTGIRWGIPVVVAPSVATLFVGEPYYEPFPLPGGGVGLRKVAAMVLSFDHRVLNGVGAGAFLNDVAANVARLPEDLEGLSAGRR